MPYYEVKLEAVCVCLVWADTQEEATKLAIHNVDMDEYEFVEATTSDEIKSDDHIRSLRRHAEKVIE